MEQKSEIVLYQPEGAVSLEVRLENETVWLNRQQIAELFDRDIKTIGKHINNALREELTDISVVAKFATTATDGKVYQMEYYNLDMVLSIGYRVKSKRGVEFRQWANKVLKEYMLKGYAINQRIESLEKNSCGPFRKNRLLCPPFLTADRGYIFCRPDIRRLQIRLRSCQVSPKKYRPFRQLYRRICLDFIRETRKIGVGGDLYG